MEQTINPRGKLWAALASAQAEIKAPKHNKTVDMTLKSGRRLNFTYADLKACLEAALPVLSKYGLAISQKTKVTERGVALVTTLGHMSGEFDESEYPLPQTSDMKEAGGNLTYLKRYQACAMIGLASDEDLDFETTTSKADKKDLVKSKSSSNTSTLHREHSSKTLTKFDNYPWSFKVSKLEKEIGDIELIDLHRLVDAASKSTAKPTKAQEATIKAMKVAIKKLEGGEVPIEREGANGAPEQFGDEDSQTGIDAATQAALEDVPF
jgi:hypothetical protein